MVEAEDISLDINELLKECEDVDESEDLTNEEDLLDDSDEDFSDFDFSEFYQDEDTDSKQEIRSDDLGIVYNEESYDEILDLHSDVSNISVDANYPYIRVSGFLIKEEINFMCRVLQDYMDRVNSSYSSDELIDIILNINNEDYIVGKVPLVLDTFLTIFMSHRYDVSLVRSPDSENIVTSELMKAFLFT